eukprot:TRINITY_DN9715_c0_g1_i2.p1 TRINITY_DN9715_c0_g1~~TRINITY_DN9715_c0_g1_i2.p1  ORF type:complete len:235 (+),score=49.81 TRINITY_DN9715_c0_g1_i2:36-740(+)
MPSEVPMMGSEPNSLASNVTGWSTKDVVAWAISKGFEPYSSKLANHQIDGKILPLLGEAQLREMGFDLIGPRIAFLNALKGIQKAERMKQRNEILWEGEEVRLGPCGGCCPFGFPCCCFTQPAAYYKLNHYKVSISEADHNCAVCPCLSSICGYTFKTDNVDLDQIQDVDTRADQPGCCKGLGYISLTQENGNKYEMRIDPKEVQRVSEKIQMAVEDAELRSQAVLNSAPGQAF